MGSDRAARRGTVEECSVDVCAHLPGARPPLASPSDNFVTYSHSCADRSQSQAQEVNSTTSRVSVRGLYTAVADAH